eukprot:TRINITY_DN11720_c0_g1_i17.p1 TRINITY_DN11720_c0_g1~~TRINITY_DN11720_c0_g1_i17.p1  ORF type:complete len:1115 (-),score=171.67 TRINITY_DN11720_c0_g1_i17:49-3393(-)
MSGGDAVGEVESTVVSVAQSVHVDLPAGEAEVAQSTAHFGREPPFGAGGVDMIIDDAVARMPPHFLWTHERWLPGNFEVGSTACQIGERVTGDAARLGSEVGRLSVEEKGSAMGAVGNLNSSGGPSVANEFGLSTATNLNVPVANGFTMNGHVDGGEQGAVQSVPAHSLHGRVTVGEESSTAREVETWMCPVARWRPGNFVNENIVDDVPSRDLRVAESTEAVAPGQPVSCNLNGAVNDQALCVGVVDAHSGKFVVGGSDSAKRGEATWQPGVCVRTDIADFAIDQRHGHASGFCAGGTIVGEAVDLEPPQTLQVSDPCAGRNGTVNVHADAVRQAGGGVVFAGAQHDVVGGKPRWYPGNWASNNIAEFAFCDRADAKQSSGEPRECATTRCSTGGGSFAGAAVVGDPFKTMQLGEFHASQNVTLDTKATCSAEDDCGAANVGAICLPAVDPVANKFLAARWYPGHSASNDIAEFVSGDVNSSGADYAGEGFAGCSVSPSVAIDFPPPETMELSEHVGCRKSAADVHAIDGGRVALQNDGFFAGGNAFTPSAVNFEPLKTTPWSGVFAEGVDLQGGAAVDEARGQIPGYSTTGAQSIPLWFPGNFTTEDDADVAIKDDVGAAVETGHRHAGEANPSFAVNVQAPAPVQSSKFVVDLPSPVELHACDRAGETCFPMYPQVGHGTLPTSSSTAVVARSAPPWRPGNYVGRNIAVLEIGPSSGPVDTTGLTYGTTVVERPACGDTLEERDSEGAQVGSCPRLASHATGIHVQASTERFHPISSWSPGNPTTDEVASFVTDVRRTDANAAGDGLAPSFVSRGNVDLSFANEFEPPSTIQSSKPVADGQVKSNEAIASCGGECDGNGFISIESEPPRTLQLSDPLGSEGVMIDGLVGRQAVPAADGRLYGSSAVVGGACGLSYFPKVAGVPSVVSGSESTTAAAIPAVHWCPGNWVSGEVGEADQHTSPLDSQHLAGGRVDVDIGGDTTFKRSAELQAPKPARAFSCGAKANDPRGRRAAVAAASAELRALAARERSPGCFPGSTCCVSDVEDEPVDPKKATYAVRRRGLVNPLSIEEAARFFDQIDRSRIGKISRKMLVRALLGERQSILAGQIALGK